MLFSSNTRRVIFLVLLCACALMLVLLPSWRLSSFSAPSDRDVAADPDHQQRVVITRNRHKRAVPRHGSSEIEAFLQRLVCGDRRTASSCDSKKNNKDEEKQEEEGHDVQNPHEEADAARRANDGNDGHHSDDNPNGITVVPSGSSSRAAATAMMMMMAPVLKRLDMQGEIRIAAIGDSITFGNGSHSSSSSGPASGRKKGSGNYPMALEQLLVSQQQQRASSCSAQLNHQHRRDDGDGGQRIVVRNFGVNGATAGTMKKKFSYRKHKEFRLSLDWRPHVVIFLLGTNDCKTTLWKGQATYRRDLTWLIDSYRSIFTSLSNDDDAHSSSWLSNKKRKKRAAAAAAAWVGKDNAAAAGGLATRDNSNNNNKNENNRDGSSKLLEPWIILMTPPPIAVTEDTLNWSFDPATLRNEVVPVIRSIAAEKKFSLIDLHREFAEGSRWRCPPPRQDRQDSTFKCLFKDGVHPWKHTHDFMSRIVAEHICSSFLALE